MILKFFFKMPACRKGHFFRQISQKIVQCVGNCCLLSIVNSLQLLVRIKHDEISEARIAIILKKTSNLPEEMPSGIIEILPTKPLQNHNKIQKINFVTKFQLLVTKPVDVGKTAS